VLQLQPFNKHGLIFKINIVMNLLESLKSLLTQEFIEQATANLGETTGNITKALSGVVPVVLNGVVEKASNSSEEILDLAGKLSGSGLLENPAAVFSIPTVENAGDQGTSILTSLLGNQVSGISSSISSFSGIKTASAGKLMSAVAPLALGLAGKYAGMNNLPAAGLASWLNSQKETVRQAIPANLNISHFEGSSSAGAAAGTEEAFAHDHSNMPGWIMPLLLVLLGGLLVWYFMNGSDPSPEDTVQSVQIPAPAADSVEVVSSYKVRLADGSELDALKGGIEDKLVACMSDSTCTPGKDRWFDFDNLNFETGSAKITAESEVQVKNIAAILKAYPALKIKIGGYTDKTGDTKANKKLSQERADAVLAAIIAAGGNAAQLEGAEGYGSDFATVPAGATDEERKTDRRISVSVRAK
jgi:outer membrane protein OmpA-like peptidoglycan-associated protein